jgi:hypothetical protein
VVDPIGEQDAYELIMYLDEVAKAYFAIPLLVYLSDYEADTSFENGRQPQ